MTTFTQHQAWPVVAVQWTGDNVEAVKELFARHMPDDCAPYFSANADVDDWGHSIVQFEAWGDDQEVDPGMWIVVRLGLEDEGYVMRDYDYKRQYDQ